MRLSRFYNLASLCMIAISACAALVDRSLMAMVGFLTDLLPTPKRDVQSGGYQIAGFSGTPLAPSLQQAIRHELGFHQYGAPRHI